MESTEFENIGAELKTLRQAAGLTQKKLGKIIGTSSQQVMNWESGKACPPDKYWKKLTRLFGKDFVQLLVWQVTSYVERKTR